MNISNDLLYIRPNSLVVNSNIESCDIISKAIERYKPILFPPTLTMNSPPSNSENVLESLTLNINGNVECEKYIDLNSNEACKYK